MPVLRDIVARLSMELDKSSFTKANRSLKGIADRSAEIGAQTGPAIAALAAAGFGLFKLTQMASDANETLNVLNESFNEQSQSVQTWAASFATAAGRSEFELREMAATLGAVLNPLMERNTEVASEMSTTLAQLSVDLGSFFNVSDLDALAALRSGIVGETEAIKRLGIVMLDVTLEAFRLDQGITKAFKSMTIAEKTALRYEFILDQTQLAQGDAVRTSEGWANATKGLLSAFKDLGTRLGLSVLPGIEKVVIVVRNATRAFLEWQKGTKILQAVMIVLGVVGAKVALGLLVAWAPVLFPILKFTAAIIVAALVVDDFLTFMDGGDSVIGRFIDAVFGPGSATAAVNNLRDALDGMVLFWQNDLLPGVEQVTQSITQAFDKMFTAIGDWVIENQQALMRFSDAITGVLRSLAGLIGIDLPSSATDDQRREVETRRRTIGRGIGAEAVTLASSPRLAPQAALGRGTSTTSIVNNSTVNVQGNATARDAERIVGANSEAQRKAARRTRAALVQRGGG